MNISEALIREYCEIVSNFSEAVYFYSPHEDFGEFSNFSNHGVSIDEAYYKTVEHWYQFNKFEDEVLRTKVLNAKSPKEASEVGGNRSNPIRSDWNDLKNPVMMTGLKAKFTQHADLREQLIQTGEELIIENSPYDNYWGIGRTGIGLNYLGTLLMRLRSELRNNPSL